MKWSYTIRSLAGIYLLWTTFGMVQGLLDGTASTQWFWLFSVFFGVMGVIFRYTGMKGWAKINKEEKEQQAKAMEEAKAKKSQLLAGQHVEEIPEEPEEMNETEESQEVGEEPAEEEDRDEDLNQDK